MKKVFTIILIFFFAITSNAVFAQENEPDINSIFKLQDINAVGMWGAFDVNLFTMPNANNVSAYMGGRFGFIFNQNISIGFGIYGLLPTNQLEEQILEDDKPFLSMTYGGLYLEYILFPKKPFHLNFNVLLGGGSVGYSYDNHFYYDTNDEGNWEKNDYYVFQEAYGLIEPGIALEVNIASFMRVDIGASYKFYSNFACNDISFRDSDFENINWKMSLVFGKF